MENYRFEYKGVLGAFTPHSSSALPRLETHGEVHPTRRIVYSASFSGIFRGSFWGCATLFGDYLGVSLVVFCEDFEGQTIQRVNAKTGKTVFFTI